MHLASGLCSNLTLCQEVQSDPRGVLKAQTFGIAKRIGWGVLYPFREELVTTRQLSGTGAAYMDRRSGADTSEEMEILIRQFAAAEHFRSATVDELELGGDFWRRPLRPEDLEHIDFTTPVLAGTFCDLPSLAAQRMLRCMYDLPVVRLPRDSDPRTLQRRAEFYGQASRELAARVAPFLERFAFGFLEEPDGDDHQSLGELCADLEILVREEHAFATAIYSCFLHGEFLKAAFRFMFVQKWCLDANRATLDRAWASGVFNLSRSGASWPRYRSDPEQEQLLTQLAIELDVNRGPNAFWQFYLPGSLAEANYLNALAARPERSLAFVGGSFVAELEWQGFWWIARQGGQSMGIAGAAAQSSSDLDSTRTGIVARFSRALSAIEDAYGSRGLQEVRSGMRAAGRLARLARLDMETQLRWLCSVDDYAAIARSVNRRIETERPGIDRETFVEPREMCSTTHVHSDHRLVVIESGDMVFWGRPGMHYRMGPGDMILVPRGRLHGSSVESEECVYNQPIIPEDWVLPLVEESDRHRGWTAIGASDTIHK